MNKDEIYRHLVDVLKQEGAEKVSVFGSYARGEENTQSDLDILVRFSTTKSLLDLIAIEQDLSETLGIKVDLLTEKAISPYLIDNIKNEMKIIYQRDTSGE